MLLAELEIRHSRAVAPTRRVAVGQVWLPADPAPGFGGLLLAAVAATAASCLDDELREGLDRLVDDLAGGRRVPQPRLRHRFQSDVVGLDRSRHRLLGSGESLVLDLDAHGLPLPQALGAVYAARLLGAPARQATFGLLRQAVRWEGDAGESLLRHLTGAQGGLATWRSRAELRWALGVFGLVGSGPPGRADVLRRFRQLVRSAHPDHGAATNGAGARIHEITRAKRVLLREA